MLAIENPEGIVRHIHQLAPAYASGFLHLGHYLEATYWYVLGTACKRYLPELRVELSRGLDVNGSPIVRKLTDALRQGIPLIEAAQNYVQKIALSNQEVYQAWGVQRPYDIVDRYKTNDPQMHRLLEVFLDRARKKGLLREGRHPVLYCPGCRAGVSKVECSLLSRDGRIYRVPVVGQDGVEYSIMTTKPAALAGIVHFGYRKGDERYAHLQGKTLTLTLEGGGKISATVRSSTVLSSQKGTGLVAVVAYASHLDVQTLRQWGYEGVSTLYDQEGAMIRPLDPGCIVGIASQPGPVIDAYHTQRQDCRNPVVYTAPWALSLLTTPEMRERMLLRLALLDRRPVGNYPQELSPSLCAARAVITRLEPWSISRDEKRYYSLPLPGYPGCVADTWLVSSLLTQRLPGRYHRFLGSEIVGTWLVSTLIVQDVMDRHGLYSVCVHGLVLDTTGRKISKSLNNGPNLEELNRRYSSSILRRGLLAKDFYGNFVLLQEDFSTWERVDHKLKNIRIFLDRPGKRIGQESYKPSGPRESQIAALIRSYHQDSGGPVIPHSGILRGIREEIYNISRDVLSRRLSQEAWMTLRARIDEISRIFALYQ